MDIALTILATLAVIATICVLVVRREVRRDQQPGLRSVHDTTYGKDVSYTEPAAHAVSFCGGGGD